LKRPYGLTDAHMPPIVELNKALYSLPKASQNFEEFLSQALLKLGFVRTVSDQQLFILPSVTYLLMLMIYLLLALKVST